MGKELSELSLRELWNFFPIFLTEHKEEWNIWYEEELLHLKSYLPMNNIARISHIGSTAINRIWAKPIIDILIEVKQDYYLSQISNAVQKAGYLLMCSNEKRSSFNKGYTSVGFAERVFHLHLRCLNDNDELYFRDYLNENPDIAHKYEELKLELWPNYEHDRDGYTSSKTDFTKRYTTEAKSVYGEKYYLLLEKNA